MRNLKIVKGSVKYVVSHKRKGMPDDIREFTQEYKAKAYYKRLKQNGAEVYLTKV